MTICPNCGAQIPDGYKFCASCGTPVQQAAPAQPQNNDVYQQPSYTAPAYSDPSYTQPEQSFYSAPAYSAPSEPVDNAQANPYGANTGYVPQQSVPYSQPYEPSTQYNQSYNPYAQNTPAAQVNPYAQQNQYVQQNQFGQYNGGQYGAYPQNQPAAVPAKKKKKTGLVIGIIAAVIACLVIGYILVSGGNTGTAAAVDDETLGEYIAYSAELNGVTVNMDELFDGGEFSIELKKNGKCTIYVGDEFESGKYTISGKKFEFTGSSVSGSGYLKDGVITLENLLDTGVTVTLYKDGEEPEEDAIQAAPEAEPALGTGDDDNGSNDTGSKDDSKDADDDKDSVLGVYNGYSLEINGYLVALDEVVEAQMSFELKDGGKATLIIIDSSGENPTEGTWKLTGDAITLEFIENGEKYNFSGTIKDGEIIFVNFFDTACNAHFFREDVEPHGDLLSMDEITGGYADGDEGLDGQLAFWNGTWYGWWIWEDCSGEYEKLDGYWWDCCADIEVNADGTATMTFWDETSSRDAPAGTIELYIDTSSGTYGVAYGKSGSLYYSSKTVQQWAFNPDEWKVDNLIGYTGTYEDSTGGFTYTIMLRPWGQLWDDLDEDYLPYAYETWYLPLVNAGEACTDVIGEFPDSMQEGN